MKIYQKVKRKESWKQDKILRTKKRTIIGRTSQCWKPIWSYSLDPDSTKISNRWRKYFDLDQKHFKSRNIVNSIYSIYSPSQCYSQTNETNLTNKNIKRGILDFLLNFLLKLKYAVCRLAFYGLVVSLHGHMFIVWQWNEEFDNKGMRNLGIYYNPSKTFVTYYVSAGY